MLLVVRIKNGFICQKTGGLSYSFVNAELGFGAGNLTEKFEAFFFCWRLNTNAAISADIYAVISFSTIQFFKLCYVLVPLSETLQTVYAVSFIFLMS
jgi:hypothetical protein